MPIVLVCQSSSIFVNCLSMRVIRNLCKSEYSISVQKVIQKYVTVVASTSWPPSKNRRPPYLRVFDKFCKHIEAVPQKSVKLVFFAYYEIWEVLVKGQTMIGSPLISSHFNKIFTQIWFKNLWAVKISSQNRE